MSRQTSPQTFRRNAVFDAVVAVIALIAAAVQWHWGERAAAEAAKQYGRNIDSGAMNGVAAVMLIILACILTAAALLNVSRHRAGPFLHFVGSVGAGLLAFLAVLTMSL